jgi:hypothetical protein
MGVAACIVYCTYRTILLCTTALPLSTLVAPIGKSSSWADNFQFQLGLRPSLFAAGVSAIVP